jgi:hypothetical protein
MYNSRQKLLLEIISENLGLNLFAAVADKDPEFRYLKFIISQWFGTPKDKDLGYFALERVSRGNFPTAQQQGIKKGIVGFAESTTTLIGISGESLPVNQALADMLSWVSEIPSGIHHISITHPSLISFNRAVQHDREKYDSDGIILSNADIFIPMKNSMLPHNIYYVGHHLRSFALREISLVTQDPQSYIKSFKAFKPDEAVLQVPCLDKVPLQISATKEWIPIVV